MALEDFTGDCGSGLSANIASTLATSSRDIETEKLSEVRKLPLFLEFDVYINQQVTGCLLEPVWELHCHPPGFANPAQRAEKYEKFSRHPSFDGSIQRKPGIGLIVGIKSWSCTNEQTPSLEFHRGTQHAVHSRGSVRRVL